MGFHRGPKINTDGLVLAYDAGSYRSYPNSGTSLYDLSGNGNTGTLTNGPVYNSSNGGNITFDGSNDFISIPDIVLYNYKASTLEAFIYIQTMAHVDNSHSIFGGVAAGSNHGYHEIRNSGNGWKMCMWTSANGWRYANTSLSQQTWYHVTWVWVGLTLTWYLNGVNDGSYTFSTMSPYGLGINAIGAFRSGGTGERYINGKIPLARIYNRQLSAEEVLRNYNSHKNRFGLT